MSSNIEKLLEHMFNLKGERLVIGIQEPLFILKAGKKVQLMNRILNEREFNFFEAELAKIFNGSEEFTYKGNPVRSVKQGMLREFFIPAETPAPPPPQTQVEAPPPPPQARPEAPSQPPPPAPPKTPPPQPAQAPRAVAPDWKLNLDELLILMVERQATDLHLSAKCKPVIRVAREMHTLEEYPIVEGEELLNEIIRIAPEKNIKEFDETNDTDFVYSLEGGDRYRTNIFRDARGAAAVFRSIPAKIMTVEELELPPKVLQLCESPKGLILVTGPSGSGKTTTLAALINHINETRKKHIITIEHPLEYIHANKLSLVNQREVNTHTRSFEKALNAVSKEDPDIIVIGEMRDLGTITAALELAVSGRLVLGCLNSSTALGTIDGVVRRFPADQHALIRAMLSETIICIVSQILLKGKEKGLVPAFEVLTITSAACNMIRDGKSQQLATIMQTGKSQGMQTFNSHLVELVEKERVEADEALEKSNEKDSLKSALKGKGLLKEEEA